MPYPIPVFVQTSGVTQGKYSDWLRKKAQSHVKRDRERGNKSITVSGYKQAIHEAIITSDGKDAYTGKILNWGQIGTYNNDDAKKDGRRYKQKFGDTPTIDHVGDGTSAPDFKICSWRVNDAKNDLNENEFLELCEQVLAHMKKMP